MNCSSVCVCVCKLCNCSEPSVQWTPIFEELLALQKTSFLSSFCMIWKVMDWLSALVKED